MEIRLRSYQEEVVQPALRGENSIIWLPTGGGKTRTAVYVTQKHLESNPKAKVVVLVNKVHLVDQHYEREFKPHLGPRCRVVAISGDTDEKDFFGLLVRESDVVICTAQILENALASPEEDKHVELTDFTLLVVDECHHTQKENVYNKIMRRYVQKKLKREPNLPQVLGLTASPGAGGKKSLNKAFEHVLQICANLDSKIVSTKNFTAVLQETVPVPRKHYDIVEKRDLDPLADQLKQMMEKIHKYMPETARLGLRTMGTQEYEADVVELEKTGVKALNRRISRCALHLRQYNDALLINESVRMIDAVQVLEEFYESEKHKMLDGTDLFLWRLFEEHHRKLTLLALDAQYENPKLNQLQSRLVKQFQDKDSRGIIFAKTRRGTRCLYNWVNTNTKLQHMNIRAGILIGAGNGGEHMTQRGQKDTIQTFRDGVVNLLISTTVAEEGLDIPECNVVVRYGLLTNEIAQQQASGRARAQDSVYSVVAQRGGREIRREIVNEQLDVLTSQAISEVQSLTSWQFQMEIFRLQNAAVFAQMQAEEKKNKRRRSYRSDQVKLQCRGCFRTVCDAQDIRKIEESQHVNINPQFKMYFETGSQVHLDRVFEDWEPGRVISCRQCKMSWGMEIKFRKVAILPCLKIKSFSLETADGIKTCKFWKDVMFTVPEYDPLHYMESRFHDMDFDD